jgi:hypothetical protein
MSIRFLLAGDTLPTNPWNRDRLPAIKKAATGFNFDIMDIYEFNSREEAHEMHKMKGVGYFDSKGINLHELNEKFYKRIKSYNCNVLILGTADTYGWFLLPETVEKLQKDGIFVVGILGDDEFTYKSNRLYVPMFDKVIAYVRKCVDYYNSIKPGCCYYFPSSCYFPESNFQDLQIDDEKKKFDVTLMGAPFGVRPKLIKALVDAGINVALFGSPKWKEFDDFKAYYHGYVLPEDIPSTIQTSKIILALLEDHLTGALHMNTKIWDAVKYGQMCITSRYLPLVEDYGFIENEDIVMYNSTEDLVDKVKYYLNHPRARKQIAENLFRKVKENLDYVDLYKNLFLNLEQEYYKKQKRQNHNGNYITPSVTIIDLSNSSKSHPGFNYLKISRKVGWKKQLKKNYQQIIKTPYVILTYGSFIYSRYLNRVVDLFPDEFVDGKAFLRLISSKPFDRIWHFVDTDTVVWKKEKFFEQCLGKWNWSRYFYSKDILYHFGNLRLCDTGETRLVYRVATSVVRCVKAAKQYLKRLITGA